MCNIDTDLVSEVILKQLILTVKYDINANLGIGVIVITSLLLKRRGCVSVKKRREDSGPVFSQ